MNRERPLRVLQVVWRLSLGGGAPRVVRTLLEQIDHDEFELHVCTVRPVLADEKVQGIGERVTYHPIGLLGPPRFLLRVRALVAIARVVWKVRPDVLHVHSGTAWYSAPGALIRRRMAKILEVHDAPQSARLSGRNLLIERAMHRWLGFQPLVHSRDVRTGVGAAWGIDPHAVPLVPLGVDLSAFAGAALTRAEVRVRLGLPVEPALVLYVARLVPEKRPDLFIAVADRVRNARVDVVFALVGGGSQLGQAREHVHRLGLDGAVSVPGFVDDLASTYHAADIFLSTSRYEGFGLAIAEAMASGLPVVSTRVGGVEDVIGPAGVLVGSGDPDQLADAVIRLLDDPDRRRSLGSWALDRARDVLDVRSTARGFEAEYRRAVAR